MKTHPQNSIELANRIVAMAEDALYGLDLVTKHWPSDFRAIVWDAVADIALTRAQTARHPD
jgi:hypothetical protein